MDPAMGQIEFVQVEIGPEPWELEELLGGRVTFINLADGLAAVVREDAVEKDLPTSLPIVGYTGRNRFLKGPIALLRHSGHKLTSVTRADEREYVGRRAILIEARP
jgi:hypothetical protein